MINVANDRMEAKDEYAGPFALMSVAVAKAECEARSELAKFAESDAKRSENDAEHWKGELDKVCEMETMLKQQIKEAKEGAAQQIEEAKENAAKFDGDAKKHFALMHKAMGVVKKFEEDESLADACGHQAKLVAKTPGRSRSSSSSSESAKRRRGRSESAGERPVTPPRYAGVSANFVEGQGRRRPLKITELEKVKYCDSVCYRCGYKGHQGRHCDAHEAKCFTCGSAEHKAANCPEWSAKSKGRDETLWFDWNSTHPEQVAAGKKRGYRYFHEAEVDVDTTVLIQGIPPDANEEDWLPYLIKGGSLNWGWANRRVIAVNVLRDRCPARGRYLVNCGEAFIKLAWQSDVEQFVKEFDGLILIIRSGEARLRVSKAKRDLVCYNPSVKSPMAIRAFDDVWDILDPRYEE